MKKALFFLLFAFVAGCHPTVTGGDTSGAGGGTGSGTSTGTGTGPFACSDPACEGWAGTWTVTAVTGSIDLAFVKTDTKISGSIDIGASSCWGNAQLEGTIQADNVTFGAVLADGKKLEFTGNITGNDAAGTFVDQSLCSPDGSWTVTRK